jgi:hypothetical protein
MIAKTGKVSYLIVVRAFKKKDLFSAYPGAGTTMPGRGNLRLHFGEGLKNSLLKLISLKRSVHAVTVGYEFTAWLHKDKEFDTNIMVVQFKKCRNKKAQKSPSTVLKRRLNENEVIVQEFSNSLLRKLTKIFIYPVAIFMQMACRYPKYTVPTATIINNKRMLTHDRNTVDTEIALNEITKNLSRTKSFKVCMNYLKNWERALTILSMRDS